MFTSIYSYEYNGFGREASTLGYEGPKYGGGLVKYLKMNKSPSDHSDFSPTFLGGLFYSTGANQLPQMWYIYVYVYTYIPQMWYMYVYVYTHIYICNDVREVW